MTPSGIPSDASDRYARDALPRCYLSLAKGFAISRTVLMNSCANGLRVRFFSVMIPVGRGIAENPTFNILRGHCHGNRKSADKGPWP